jgi:hypothetical protein
MGDPEKRERVKQLAREAAWDEQKDCPTCKGDGRVPGGRKVIHSRLGGFGADWDLDSVLNAIDNADQVRWAKSLFGHDLVVVTGDKVVSFEVRKPEDWDAEAAS